MPDLETSRSSLWLTKSLPDGQKDTWAHFCTAFRARWVDKAIGDSEDPQAPTVETFITALEPYLKKQINEITENLEKKNKLNFSVCSFPTKLHKPQFS